MDNQNLELTLCEVRQERIKIKASNLSLMDDKQFLSFVKNDFSKLFENEQDQLLDIWKWLEIWERAEAYLNSNDNRNNDDEIAATHCKNEIGELNELADKYSFAIRRGDIGITILQGEEAISDIIKLAEESNSKKIYYKLQSNRKDTLNVGLIRNLVNIFSRYKENNEIKKLVVSGREGDEDKNTHIDLIVNRLKLEIETSLKRNMDLLLVNAKIDQMTKAYNSIRSELLKVYKSE